MNNRRFAGLLLAACLVTPILAQMPEGYLDMDIAKVKMGKRGEFNSINKTMKEINRKNKGDNWLVYEIMYGDPNTVCFVSARASYAAAEQGAKSFEGALTKSLGAAGMQKLFDSWDATVDNEQALLRRRRWDLTAGAPANPAAYNELVGHARYLRLVTIHVRSGHITEFEAALRTNKDAQERANPGIGMLVSQGAAGEQLGVFYITTLLKSLADLDGIKPLQEVLGSSYGEYEKIAAAIVSSTDIRIGRFLPDLSNPPDEIVAVDPKFWRPAPPPAPAKPAAETKK
jgi:hypothetical protein